MTNDLASLDDGALVGVPPAHRDAAFREIMRRHREPLYRLVRGLTGDPEEALDIVQEVFASAYRHLNRFDPARPLRPWLARIAINRSRDWHRRRRLRRFLGLGLDSTEMVADDAPLPDAALAARQRLDLAWPAIARLPAPLREALLLRTIEGLSQSETAEILSITPKAVETRLYRARAQLAAMLGDEG